MYLIPAPTVSPAVTLEDMKAFLRVDFTKDDAIITSMILSATRWAEAYLNRVLTSQSITGNFSIPGNGLLCIPRSPVTAVTQIDYTFAGTTTTLVEGDDYIFIQKSGTSMVRFLRGLDLDNTVPYQLQVTFTVGYTTIPNEIIDGIKQHVAHLYENRGDVQPVGGESIPENSIRLYSPYRMIAGYE